MCRRVPGFTGRPHSRIPIYSSRRLKLSSYCFAIVFVLICYPVPGIKHFKKTKTDDQ